MVGTRSSGATSPLTLASGVLTANSPGLTITQTWNNAGVTFNPFLVNVTNTASAAASTLLDLQISSTSVFKVDATGVLDLRSPNTSLGFATGYSKHYIGSNSSRTQSSIMLDAWNILVSMRSGGILQWTNSATDADTTADTGLARVSAGLAEVNSGTAGTRRDLAVRGIVEPVQTASTSVNITAYGITTLNTTATKVAVIDAPVAGVRKSIILTLGSTSYKVTTGGTSVATFNGTGHILTFDAIGDAVILQGVDTTRYAILSNEGSVTAATV